MSRLTLAALLAGFLFTATPHRAAADIIQPYSDGTFQILAFQPIGQTFTAIDADIASIGFGLSAFNPSSGVAPITVRLLAGAGLGGPVIASVTQTPPAGFQSGFNDPFFPNPAFTLYDFDFTGTTLTPGQPYTVLLETPNPYWGIQNLDTFFVPGYPGGQSILFGAFEPQIDLTFRVQAASAPVPEPTTAILMGGLIMLGGVFRYRLGRHSAVV